MFLVLRKTRSGGFSVGGIQPTEIIARFTIEGTNKGLWPYLIKRIDMLDDIELGYQSDEQKRKQQAKPSKPQKHK
jgi:hypothetical protein